MKICFDFRDWWIGYYRGDEHHYICPLPTVVIRWRRRLKYPREVKSLSPYEYMLLDIYRDRLVDQLSIDHEILKIIEKWPKYSNDEKYVTFEIKNETPSSKD